MEENNRVIKASFFFCLIKKKGSMLIYNTVIFRYITKWFRYMYVYYTHTHFSDYCPLQYLQDIELNTDSIIRHWILIPVYIVKDCIQICYSYTPSLSILHWYLPFDNCTFVFYVLEFISVFYMAHLYFSDYRCKWYHIILVSICFTY